MKKRVLIVDDSATIRSIIRAQLVRDPRLEVVGEACDPYEAREKIKSLNPDVLTLDVEMPKMNGIDFLEKLMRLRPLPVVMVSTETHQGSAAALEALSLGAVDCIGKPRNGDLQIAFEGLADRLIAAANARVNPRCQRKMSQPMTDFKWNGRYVFIGSSTGGVDALETVLSGYPANCPPTLITQHMPESFLCSFARRLDAHIAPHFSIARNEDPLLPGHVYLAPGGDYHLEVKPGHPPRCHLLEADKVSGHRPSVDVLFRSAISLASHAIGVILTGMGRDGAEGLAALRQAGARCFAQNEATCVVYGMPRAAIELGAAERSLPIGDVSSTILELSGKVETYQMQRSIR